MQGRVAVTLRRMKPRAKHHAIVWFVFWPLLSIAHATLLGASNPLIGTAPGSALVLASAAGVFYMLPEFLMAATILWLLTITLFGIFDSNCEAEGVLGYEAMLAGASAVLGVALAYPAVFAFPCWVVLRNLPVWLLATFAFAAVLFCSVHLGRRHYGHAGAIKCSAPVLGCCLLLHAVTYLPVGRRSSPPSDLTVVLGLDSIAYSDDVGLLRAFATEHLQWYNNAITPGLLTNAVWASIMMQAPPDRTGVALTFQNPDWSRSSFNLVRAAKSSGRVTWSLFTDQFTTAVGSTGGFDHDRSGPVGWYQLATSTVKDGSVLLPLLMSRGLVPIGHTPANQANTYCYDVAADMRWLFSGHSRPAFVAAHIDYLHQATYPRFRELNPQERAIVWRAKAATLADFSVDWQYPVVPGEPIHIYEWKLRHLQEVMIDELKRSGFLDPNRRNRLVAFSDHGKRIGLTVENFSDPRYYHVILFTFGVPAEDHNPISLVDIPVLLGYSPRHLAPALPVQYTNLEPSDWHTAQLHWDGTVTFNPKAVSAALRGLKTYYVLSGDQSKRLVLSNPGTNQSD